MPLFVPTDAIVAALRARLDAPASGGNPAVQVLVPPIDGDSDLRNTVTVTFDMDDIIAGDNFTGTARVRNVFRIEVAGDTSGATVAFLRRQMEAVHDVLTKQDLLLSRCRYQLGKDKSTPSHGYLAMYHAFAE